MGPGGTETSVNREVLSLSWLGNCGLSPEPLSPPILHSPLVLGLNAYDCLVLGLKVCDKTAWPLVALVLPSDLQASFIY